MIFGDLPIFPEFDPSLTTPTVAQMWAAGDELARRADWPGKCMSVLRLAAQDRAQAMRQLERFVDGIGGIGMLNFHELTKNMWLDEQIAFFSRETGLRPENPRGWKMLGLAYLLKGYFDAKYYRPAAESYAECIRRINQYPEGVIVGLVMAGIGPLTPNRPRFELGLALAGAGEFKSAVCHLKFCGEGQVVLNRAGHAGVEKALQVALEEYQLERLGECCANQLFPSPQNRGRVAQVMFMACIVCGENLAFEQVYPSTWQCPICGNLTTFEGPNQSSQAWHPIVSGLLRPTIPVYEPIRIPQNLGAGPMVPGMPPEQIPMSTVRAMVRHAEELLEKGSVDEAVDVL
jgi:hypothetical protein